MIATLKERGLYAYDDLETPVTWHAADKPLNLDWEPQDGQSWMPMKPHNGLWSAPEATNSTPGNLITTWDDFNHYNHRPVAQYRYRLTPDPSAVVLRIKTSADVKAAEAAFPPDDDCPAHYRKEAGLVSFTKMRAAGITAVSWERGYANIGHPVDGAWYAWDVNSVVWLTPDAAHITGEPITAGTQPPVDDDWDDEWDEEWGWLKD